MKRQKTKLNDINVPFTTRVFSVLEMKVRRTHDSSMVVVCQPTFSDFVGFIICLSKADSLKKAKLAIASAHGKHLSSLQVCSK